MSTFTVLYLNLESGNIHRNSRWPYHIHLISNEFSPAVKIAMKKKKRKNSILTQENKSQTNIEEG